MYFYTQDPNGKITGYAEVPDDAPNLEEERKGFEGIGFIATDRQIISLSDGTMLFADQMTPAQQASEQQIALAAAKHQKHQELKSQRDAAELAPVHYCGKNYDFDRDAIARINNGIDILETTEAVLQWTCADNTEQTVNAGDLKAIKQIGAERAVALHQRYRTLREQTEACTTLAEIEAIQWAPDSPCTRET